MPRLAPLVAVLALLGFAVPARGQEVPGIDIGEPAIVGYTTIKLDGGIVGTLIVNRVGEGIEATAQFTVRPPGRRARLCVVVDGDRECVERKPRRRLKLELQRTGDFTAPLTATVRSGAARGKLSM